MHDPSHGRARLSSWRNVPRAVRRPTVFPGPRDPRGTRLIACGHSNRPFADFLALLEAHGVRRLVDIRRHAGSRAVPWASGEALEEALASQGIAYTHLPALGGRRKPVAGSRNTAWRNEQFRGYADHMESDEFRQGVARLLDLGAKEQVAVMCSEAVPWRCHRSLLADWLVANGHEVVQAIDATHSAPHKVTAFARLGNGRVTYPGEQPLDVG